MTSSNGVQIGFANSQDFRQAAAAELLWDNSFEADVVLRIKPTLVRLSKASICDGTVAWLMGLDSEVWTQMYLRDGVPYQIGVPGEGWYPVDAIQLPRDPGGSSDPSVAGWARLSLGVCHPIPPYMVLSSYDIGHPVVVTLGEFLGTTGMVESIRHGSVILSGGAGHRFDAIGAIRTGTREGDAKLAPLKALLPVGSRAWARHTEELGGDWVPAIVSDYLHNDSYPAVELWLPEEKITMTCPRDRRMILDGSLPKPQPTRVSRGKGVPSSKSPFRRSGPPAKF